MDKKCLRQKLYNAINYLGQEHAYHGAASPLSNSFWSFGVGLWAHTCLI